jgi:signal transduction histidine kinase
VSFRSCVNPSHYSVCLDFLASKATVINQFLILDLSENPLPALTADPLALESTYGNLISIALNYTQDGGEIRVRVEAVGISIGFRAHSVSMRVAGRGHMGCHGRQQGDGNNPHIAHRPLLFKALRRRHRPPRPQSLFFQILLNDAGEIRFAIDHENPLFLESWDGNTAHSTFGRG